MRRSILAMIGLSSLLMAACTTPSAGGTRDLQAAEQAEATQIMVVGTYHFAGATSDLINIDTDSVLSAKRQNELENIAEAFIQFDPTHIVVERVTNGPDYIDTNYAEYGSAMLAKTENERVQLGYRIAARAGLSIVHGIDEQPTEGEPDYFPFDRLMAHAEKTGQADELKSMLAATQQAVETTMSQNADASMAAQLLAFNMTPLSTLNASFYYNLSKYDVAEDQPGAELQAYWFMRNAKIFSKIVDVTAPGDRVIVIYGAGHKYWLENLVDGTTGYIRVDPAPYLVRADAHSE